MLLAVLIAFKLASSTVLGALSDPSQVRVASAVDHGTLDPAWKPFSVVMLCLLEALALAAFASLKMRRFRNAVVTMCGIFPLSGLIYVGVSLGVRDGTLALRTAITLFVFLIVSTVLPAAWTSTADLLDEAGADGRPLEPHAARIGGAFAFSLGVALVLGATAGHTDNAVTVGILWAVTAPIAYVFHRMMRPVFRAAFSSALMHVDGRRRPQAGERHLRTSPILILLLLFAGSGGVNAVAGGFAIPDPRAIGADVVIGGSRHSCLVQVDGQRMVVRAGLGGADSIGTIACQSYAPRAVAAALEVFRRVAVAEAVPPFSVDGDECLVFEGARQPAPAQLIAECHLETEHPNPLSTLDGPAYSISWPMRRR